MQYLQFVEIFCFTSKFTNLRVGFKNRIWGSDIHVLIWMVMCKKEKWWVIKQLCCKTNLCSWLGSELHDFENDTAHIWIIKLPVSTFINLKYIFGPELHIWGTPTQCWVNQSHMFWKNFNSTPIIYSYSLHNHKSNPKSIYRLPQLCIKHPWYAYEEPKCMSRVVTTCITL